ncbi:MAG: FG-GAP repeat protein [Planctomycetota bacterium]
MRRTRWAPPAFAFVLACAAPAEGQVLELVEGALLSADPPLAGSVDAFGRALAGSGAFAFAGAPQRAVAGLDDAGVVFVHKRVDGQWTPHAVLGAPEPQTQARFGTGLAADGDTVAVGAPGLFGGALGMCYVFGRAGSSWELEATLVPSGAATGDEFGSAVALDGDTLVVGGALHDGAGLSGAGGAWIFTRRDGLWAEVALLTASDAAPQDAFGSAVAVEGQRVAVGAPLAGSATQGAVYLFEAAPDGTWPETARLAPPGPATSRRLGTAVALDGGRLLAGAPGPAIDGSAPLGGALLFEQQAGAWVLTAELASSEDLGQGERFGESVLLAGSRAVVGAPRHEQPHHGAGYVFLRVDGAWTEQAKLVASAPGTNDLLGSTAALAGGEILLGAAGDDLAPSVGSVRVFPVACAGSIAAVQSVRVGAPPNPSALAAPPTPPVLGARWEVAIDHGAFLPFAVLDALVVATGPANVPSAAGTVLVDLSTPPLLLLSGLPGAPFEIVWPADCSFAGLSLALQGGATTGLLPFGATVELTNAIDVTLGTLEL